MEKLNWMETIKIVIDIGILTALIIGYFLIKNLLPNYFAEKGKNLATKEDIEEITKKIKTVESKINIRENGEIDYNTLKRKTILEYFGAYNNWERVVVDASSKTGGNEIILEKIRESKLNYNLKEGEIEIFIDDTAFYYLRKNVSIELLLLQHEFENHCLNIDYIEKNESDAATKCIKIREEKQNYDNILIKKFTVVNQLRNELISYLEIILKESFKQNTKFREL